MPKVLERKRWGKMNPQSRPEIDMQIQNGPFTIYNVPHVQRKTPGPNGEEYQLKLSTAYKISAICEFMEDKNLFDFDYKLLNQYEDICNKLS